MAEEHFIMIEPNVKYVLNYADMEDYVPTPWYKRPPPVPENPPPTVCPSATILASPILTTYLCTTGQDPLRLNQTH